jgi:hypothetical protein
MSTRESDKEALKFSLTEAREPEMSRRCPYCQDEFGDSIKIIECKSCAVQLHRLCAQELKLQCPTLGCATTFEQAPRIEDHSKQYARFLIAPDRPFAHTLPIVAFVLFILGGVLRSNLVLQVSAAIAGWWGVILALSGLRMGLALLRVSDGTDMERRVGHYVAVEGSAQATAPLYTPVYTDRILETYQDLYNDTRTLSDLVPRPRQAQALYWCIKEEHPVSSDDLSLYRVIKEYCVPFVIGDVTVHNQPTKTAGLRVRKLQDSSEHQSPGSDRDVRLNYLPPDQNTLAIGQLIRDNRRLLMVPHKSLGLFVANEARTGRLAFNKILKGLTGLAILYIGVTGIFHTWVFR